MWNSLLLIAIFSLLALIVLGALAVLWGWRADTFQPLAGGAFALSLALLLLLLATRIFSSGRAPFSSMYEFIILFTAATLAVFLMVNTRYKSTYLSLLAAILALILLSAGTAFPQDVKPLMPALQSGWLKFHVITAVIAYGLFGIAFCLGLIYLLGLGTEQNSKNIEAAHIYKLVGWGEFFLTLVLITGAVWAEEVWGAWWSWDPKETWALVTWLLYAAYLHAFRIREWRGKKSVVLAVIGFVVVMFTLLGVSTLLPGNHSYV